MTATLKAEIAALIAREGPLPMRRYMALALGHPTLGYYMARDPFGTKGDFITAPEISQMFGELMGLWAVAQWQAMGAPAPFRLVELGPGRGTLMADALRAARLVPAFGTAARVHLVETSPHLAAAQKRTLRGAAPAIAWHPRLEEVPDGPVLVLANEFFDAIPIDQYVRGTDGWHARRVGLGADGRLAFTLDPAPSPAVDALTARFGPAPEGAIFERMEEGPALALAHRIARTGGAALVVDYGHGGGLGETLQAMRRHRFVDPLDAPGEADLTAHVDFSALGRLARAEGARAFGPLTQGDFLARLGLAQRAARLKAGASQAASADIDAAARRLAGTGEGEMGTLFKVMVLSHGQMGAPVAFDPSEEFEPC